MDESELILALVMGALVLIALVVVLISYRHDRRLRRDLLRARAAAAPDKVEPPPRAVPPAPAPAPAPALAPGSDRDQWVRL